MIQVYMTGLFNFTLGAKISNFALSLGEDPAALRLRLTMTLKKQSHCIALDNICSFSQPK